MSRYIDAENINLKGKFSCGLNDDGILYVPFREIQKIIDDVPTADVEEVTRCKDCLYCVGLLSCDKHEEQTRRCQRFGLNLMHGNGYCFWGQKDKEKEK